MDLLMPTLILYSKKQWILPSVVKYFSALTASFLFLALTACSTGPKAVFHSFSYGAPGDNHDIEILNYQYGSSKFPATRPANWDLEKGHIGQGGNIGGVFPIGDFLYVKWRIESTGETYEDKVDLKSRLPDDITNQRIHFLIKGPQLYVYLISQQRHAAGETDCPVMTYHGFKCVTLYPERNKNF
jgi:hypothetical protein